MLLSVRVGLSTYVNSEVCDPKKLFSLCYVSIFPTSYMDRFKWKRGVKQAFRMLS